MKTNTSVFVVFKTYRELKCQFSENIESVSLFTEILWRTVWRNKWPSVFDVVKKLRYKVLFFFLQWICWIWLFELKLMIVLLSAPSSPVQNRRLLSARNARMSSIEMPDDNEKSVSSASTSPCHSPVNTFAKYVTVFLLWFS